MKRKCIFEIGNLVTSNRTIKIDANAHGDSLFLPKGVYGIITNVQRSVSDVLYAVDILFSEGPRTYLNDDAINLVCHMKISRKP